MSDSVHKILHIITRLDVGGSAENTLLTSLGQSAKGHSVTIISGLSDNPDSINESRAIASGIRIIRIKSLIRNISPVKDTLALISLIVHLFRYKYDIVHTHTSKAGVLGRLASAVVHRGIVVHTPHGHIFYGYFSSTLTSVFVYIEKALMRFTDILITLTQKEKDDYLSKGIGPSEKIIPVFSGVGLEPFLNAGTYRDKIRAGWKINDSEIVAGTVARLVPVKNHEAIVTAACSIRDKINNLKFVFVGDGELKELLEKKIFSLGLSESFIFTGWRNDIPELMAAFDIFIMTSKNEGQGRAFVEAQAAGVPVIGTRVGGVPEVIDEGKTGLIINPDDTTALADAITRLYLDNGLRCRMAENCRKWVNPQFSAQVMVDRIENIYSETMGNPR